METLQRLTRRQLDALRAVAAAESAERGASLSEVARRLQVTPPTALGLVDPLETHGLVLRRRGKSRLTATGRDCLSEYLRHHRIAETLFLRAGLPAAATHEAALEVDLALSHRTVEELCAADGHPEVCPHGEPIAPCDRPQGRSR